MHLAQIRAENSRRFEGVTFEFAPDPNVLTGVNNTPTRFEPLRADAA